MSLGLDTNPLGQDWIIGAYLVLGLALSAESAKLASSRKPSSRGLFYMIAAIVLSLVWWISFDQKYFPSTEVNTAVIPGLAHPYLLPWQAPYGILWYWINQGIAWCGTLLFNPFLNNPGLNWMGMLALLNLSFILLFQRSELLTAYFMTSLFLWMVVPWDLSILWLVVLGFAFPHSLTRIGFVLIAAIAKLPFGASLSVWKYDFLNGQEGGSVGSALVPGHWMPYLVLGAWSLAVILSPYIRFTRLDSYTHGKIHQESNQT